ncbi:MAG: hypothetical protein WBA09_22360 [Candidatus Acidiferrum sp.]
MALSLGFLLNANSDDAQDAVQEVDAKFKNLAKTVIENKTAHKELSDLLTKIADNTLPRSAETINKLALAEQKAALASKEFAEAQANAGKETEALRERVALTSEGLRSSLYSYGNIAGGLGALLGVGLIGEYVDKLKEAVLQVQHLSATTGISVGDLTRMKDAMEESGVEADLLDRALPRLYTHIFEAGHESKIAAEAFAIFGINTDKWKTEMPSAVEVLQQISEHIEKYGVNANTAAGLSEVFGLRSQQVAAILPELIRSLKDPAFKAHAESMEKEVQAAEQLESTEARLKMQMDTLLLPTLKYAADAITGLTIIWAGFTSGINAGVGAMRGWAFAALDSIRGVAKGTYDVMHLDFSAAAKDAKESSDKIRGDFSIAMADIEGEAKKLQGSIAKAMTPPKEKGKFAPDPNDLQAYLEKQAQIKEQQKEELEAEREQAKLDKERAKKIQEFYEWQTKSLEKQKEEIALRAKEAQKTVKAPDFKDDITQGTIYAQIMKSIINGTDQLSEAVKKNTLFTREGAKQWQEYYKAMKDKTGADAVIQMVEQIITVHKKGLPTIIAFNMALRDEGKAAEESAKAQIAANVSALLQHIAGLKAMAIIKAIVNTAQGIEDLIPPPKPWSAALHFLAAAEWAKAAGSAPSGHPGAGGGGGSEARQGEGFQGATGGPQGVAGGGSRGGGDSGRGAQTVVNISGGSIMDTHNLSNLAAMLNSGGNSGLIKLNSGGSAYSIPTPAY